MADVIAASEAAILHGADHTHAEILKRTKLYKLNVSSLNEAIVIAPEQFYVTNELGHLLPGWSGM